MGLIEMVERAEFQKGKVEGKIEGKKEEAKANITKLMLNGFSAKKVAMLLEKPLEMVQKIYQKLKEEGKLSED